MILDFNRNLTDLNGLEGETPTHLGKSLANLLATAQSGDAIKYWSWALKLNNKESINVDESDYNTIKEFIKTHREAFVIFKAQALDILGSEFKK